MSYLQGTNAGLNALFAQYAGGPAVDVTGLTITITAVGGGVTLGPTSTGVVHLATGSYSYVWAVPSAQPVGDYTVLWSGTVSSVPVTATETINVAAAGSTGVATRIWYATRDAVRLSLDAADTPRNAMLTDGAIESASRSVEGLLARQFGGFAPVTGTRRFDWPNLPSGNTSYPWRLWLDGDELIRLDTLTSGGTVIPAAGYLLEPVNAGPPYTHIDINLGSTSAFSAGATWQQSIVAVGLWGYRADTAPCGQLAAAITTTTATTCAVSDSSTIGVGTILLCDTERMTVTAKAWLTTAQTLLTPVGATTADVTVAVTDGTAFHVDETLLLDSERMRVIDIAGNNLTVKRAWDGTVLAAHTGSTIYAPRTLTVVRGDLGTTAATHANAAPLTAHVVAGPAAELCLAEAQNTLLQKTSGYARTTGSGEAERPASGAGLADIRRMAKQALGRQARTRTV